MNILPFTEEIGSTHGGNRGWFGGNPAFRVVGPGEPYDFIWANFWGDGAALRNDIATAKKAGRCIFVITGDGLYTPDYDDGNFWFTTHLNPVGIAKQFQVPYSYTSSLRWYRENKGKTFDKKYLANFMGSFDTNPDRRKLIEIAGPDLPIVERDGWRLSREDHETHHRGIQEHSDLIAASCFTLCPRGIGKTSIRVVEAIMRGSIPVLLDDDTRLFGDGMRWAYRNESLSGDLLGLVERLRILRDAENYHWCAWEMQKFRDKFLLRDELDGFPNDLGYTGFILDQMSK